MKRLKILFVSIAIMVFTSVSACAESFNAGDIKFGYPVGSDWSRDTPYNIFFENDGVHMMSCTYEPKWNGESFINAGGMAHCCMYDLIDGVWIYNVNTVTSVYNGGCWNVHIAPLQTIDSVVYTDFNICDIDGNVVFRKPLPVAATAEEGLLQSLPLVQQSILGNLAVLLPLGCLILAILLGVRLIPRLMGYWV